jgi:competence protein ComEC
MPSVVRAATMLTIYGVITAIRRKAYSLNALSLAAIAMLLIRPQNLWDVGFQMSFLAVLGILLIGVPLNSYLKKNIFANYFNFDPDKGPTFGQRSWAWLLGIVVISLATQIMVAPLVAYYFGRFSCYFLLTNIVAIPLVTLILSVAFIFFLLTPFSAMQYVVGQIVMRLAEILSSVLHFIAKLPGSSIEDIHLSPLQLLLVYILEIAICFLIVRLVKHIKYWRILLSD